LLQTQFDRQLFFIRALDEILQPATRLSNQHQPAGVLFSEKIKHIIQNFTRQHKQDARLLLVLPFPFIVLALSFSGHHFFF
jgi:hypothetical protein